MRESKWLSEEDREPLQRLLSDTEKYIANKSWWLPLNSTIVDHILDPKWAKWVGVYGDKHELIAVSALFLGESLSYTRVGKTLHFNANEYAEIGCCTIRADKRGKNLMWLLNSSLVDEAVQVGKKKVVIAVHPDNIPMQKSLRLLGIQYTEKNIDCDGVLQNIYIKDI